MEWINRLIGAKSGAPNGDAVGAGDRARICQDLGRVDKLRSGLGEQLVNYV
jgi:hypothetical protein